MHLEMADKIDKGNGKIIHLSLTWLALHFRSCAIHQEPRKFSRFATPFAKRVVETKPTFFNLVLHIYFQKKIMKIRKITLKHSMKFVQTKGIGIGQEEVLYTTNQ